MRQILIRFNGRIVGGLWLRGRIEIDENGVTAGIGTGGHASQSQFCPTPQPGEALSYSIWSADLHSITTSRGGAY